MPCSCDRHTVYKGTTTLSINTYVLMQCFGVPRCKPAECGIDQFVAILSILHRPLKTEARLAFTDFDSYALNIYKYIHVLLNRKAIYIIKNTIVETKIWPDKSRTYYKNTWNTCTKRQSRPSHAEMRHLAQWQLHWQQKQQQPQLRGAWEFLLPELEQAPKLRIGSSCREIRVASVGHYACC